MNNQRTAWIWVIIIIILIIAGIFYFRSNRTETDETSSATTSGQVAGSTTIRPYGEVTLKLGETAQFDGIAIRPTSILEDSRCAEGVQCIQAGTVRVNTETTLDNGAKSQTAVGLNGTTTVDTFAISLVGVTPATKAGSKIPNTDYRLTYRVHQSAVVDGELLGK